MTLLGASLGSPAHAQTTGQSLFTTQTPVLGNAADGTSYELGMKFRVARSGQITAIRYWKSPSEFGTHVGRLWSSTGALLASTTFTAETASGWQQQSLSTSVSVQANTTYVVSVNIQTNYPFTASGLAGSIVNGDISSVADGNNGVFGAAGSFPSGSFQSSNYFRDVVFVANTLGPATKLVLSPASANTQTGVAVGYTASIQDASGNTITTATNPITFSISGVSGSFNPSSPVTASAGVASSSLTPSTAGTATITASSAGLTSASASLVVAISSGTPQSLFTTQTPAVANGSDSVPYEMGVKFQLARSGQITALRYWKSPGDTGSHVGRIWSSAGTLLASVTFINETASGWQQQSLASPLPVQANTTYVASVNIGNYYPITLSGLASPIINGDITSIADGRNGVFGTPFAFPSNAFQSSNYFRDIVFVPDTLGQPAKLALTPASTGTQTNMPVTYTAAIQDASGNTISTATNTVTFAASGVSGSFSPISVTASAGVATSTFTPNTPGAATITASATGLSNATAQLSVVSSTVTSAQSLFTAQTPALPSVSDGVSYELGMKFQLARSGALTALRYWKATGDNGAHVGRLWSSTGTLLASVTFANETASGWQQQELPTPLLVQTNTIYVVSVNIISRYPSTSSGLVTTLVNGDISSVADGNNGVYGTPFSFPTNSFQNSNYFRDVVYSPNASGPPAKLALTPASITSHTGLPVAYTANIEDSSGATVFTAANSISFSVSGVRGSFNPASSVTGTNGVAHFTFTPNTTGTATITASASGLSSATAMLTVHDIDVTTYHYDAARSGWNAMAPTLTPSIVGGTTFGLLHSVALDDQVDAQPLVVSGQTISGQGVHNVVYVATESNTIYAIDASSGAILLRANLGTPVPHSALPGACNNNGANIGINSTPVIDRQTSTMYVVTYTYENSVPVFRLHALDVSNLTDKIPPVVVSASRKLSDGTFYTFSARTARQRSALALSNGNVYAGFASFCDIEANNSRGWLLGWTAGSLAPLAANRLNDTQATSPNNFFLSSIWMSGYGVAADALGNLFFVTGNSDYSGTTYDGVTNIQESIVKISPNLTQMLGIFTPSDAQFGVSALDQGDNDFGSGGVLLLPDQPGSHPHLAVAAGKAGQMYLLDRDNLGGYNPSGLNNVLGSWSIGACWCGPAFYAGSDGVGRVVSSGGSQLTTWTLQTSPSTALVLEGQSSLLTGQDGGFFTAVSSTGTTPGTAIIWAVSRPVDTSPAQILLYAFDAVPNGAVLPQLFWGVAGTWPNVGGNSNIVPVVANGYVYVASYKQLTIFGVNASAVTASASPALATPTRFSAPTSESVAAFVATDARMPDYDGMTSDATPAGAAGVRALSRPATASLSQVSLYAFNAVSSSDAWLLLPTTVADTVPDLDDSSDVVPVLPKGYVNVAATTRSSPGTPSVPPGASQLYGKILSVEGDYLTLLLRNGKIISVDLSEALHASKAVVPAVGKTVIVTGTFAASGILHAHQMLRAKPSEQLWEPDSGPQ